MITGAETAHLSGRPAVILLEGRLPVLETPAAQSLGLRDGQVVRPTIEVRDDKIFLLLNGQSLPLPPLPPHLRLAAGDRPWFQVRVDASGRIVLQPVAGAVAGDGGAAPAMAVASTTAGRLEQLALRPPTMSALTALLQPGALQALFQAAPQAEVGAWIAALVKQWPSTSALTPEVLRRALRQGGWTQESGLARGESVPGPDTKSLLRLLLSEWTQAPASSRGLLRDALDDIESRQLQCVNEQQAGRELAFSMLLPFSDAEPVDLRWIREGGPGPGGEGAGRSWVVHLHTRSHAFGEVWLRTRVSDGASVELVMWAERMALVAQARASGASLAAWLNEAGLRMKGLQVIHGAPPAPQAGEAAAGGPGRLVDVRA